MKPIGTWIRKAPNFMRIGASQGCRAKGSKKRGIEYHRRAYRSLRSNCIPALGPGWELLVEPWYKRLGQKPAFRQPDAVLIHKASKTGIVVEVKLNWKDGRDIKLIDEYLPIVRQAEDLEVVWPLLITQCLRGWQGQPILCFEDIHRCQSWQPGDETPLMLLLV